MTVNDPARLVYLLILVGVILFYALIANRKRLNQMLRHLALWALIFIGALAIVGLWQDIRPQLAPTQIVRGDGTIEIERDFSGHYNVTVLLNGVETPFLVDTGATRIVLTREDATKAGVDLSALKYTATASTANGVVNAAPVLIKSFDLEGIQDRNVRAYVTDGELFGSLLGMDYLSRFERIVIERNRLILTR